MPDPSAHPDSWLRSEINRAKEARGYGTISIEQTNAPAHSNKLEPGSKHPPLPRTDAPDQTMNDVIRAGAAGVSPADIRRHRERFGPSD